MNVNLAWPFQEKHGRKGTWTHFFQDFQCYFTPDNVERNSKRCLLKCMDVSLQKWLEANLNSAIGQGWKEPAGGDYRISIFAVAVMENPLSPSAITSLGFWSVQVCRFTLHFVEEMWSIPAKASLSLWLYSLRSTTQRWAEASCAPYVYFNSKWRLLKAWLWYTRKNCLKSSLVCLAVWCHPCNILAEHYRISGCPSPG